MSLENCPNCGADLPRHAKVCPECGSDEKTGWSDEAYASRLDLPSEEFNYDEFVKNEFGNRRIKPRGIHWFWWIVAVIIALVFFLFLFRR